MQAPKFLFTYEVSQAQTISENTLKSLTILSILIEYTITTTFFALLMQSQGQFEGDVAYIVAYSIGFTYFTITSLVAIIGLLTNSIKALSIAGAMYNIVNGHVIISTCLFNFMSVIDLVMTNQKNRTVTVMKMVEMGRRASWGFSGYIFPLHFLCGYLVLRMVAIMAQRYAGHAGLNQVTTVTSHLVQYDPPKSVSY